MPLPIDLLRFRRRRRADAAPSVTGVHSPRLSDFVRAPNYRIIANQSEVQIGRTVRGGTWQDTAQLANWIASRGTMLVPAYSPNVAVDEGETHVFRYRVRPRYVATRFAVSMRVSSPTAIVMQITVGGVDHPYTAWPRADASSVTFIVDRDAQSSSTEQIELRVIGADSQPSGTALVEAISIEELPRALVLCDDNECGVQPELFRPRNPITNRNIHDALIDRIDNLRDATRRPSYWQFARSDLDPWSVAGTPVSLFTDPFSMLAPCFYRNDDRGVASWAALVKCSTGATEGTIDVSNIASGTSADQIAIPANTTDWTWLEGDTGFDVDAEDNTSPDGRRLARNDDATFLATRTAGAGTISIATLSIWS
jgi:hypothetical protein